MTNGNEPAFSNPAFYHADGAVDSPKEGLTKREYFAAMALQGYISTCHPFSISEEGIKVVANDALKAADALIKALNGQP